MKIRFLVPIAICIVQGVYSQVLGQVQLTGGVQQVLNQPYDVSADFSDYTNTYFFADSLSSFDVAKNQGTIHWKRKSIYPRQAFNTTTILPQDLKMLDFPETAYINDPDLKFSIDFISDNTIRFRVQTSPIEKPEQSSLMIACDLPHSKAWTCSETANTIEYKSKSGRLVIEKSPWRVKLYDANGKLMTRTRTWSDNDSTQIKVMPFNFIKRGSDNSRSINPVFSLEPGEGIFGCGESFTSLNKVGQKVNIYVTDPQGPESNQMYKPVPFFMSNRGYGMFMHTSAPITCDFGESYIGANKMFMSDESLDLFLFFGEPKEILDAYTNVTGKASLPPLWSFGTWMSRITYFSQAEGYDVANNLRKNKLPADVIHFDTGWFGVDWQCDYEFAADRFDNPQKMINDLKKDGFHISLWQLTYFTPKNRYFNEIIEKGLYVKNAAGTLPYEDAVLDFSNPATVAWYQEKLAGLLKMGVGAIKVDFGEAAPFNGFYASGRGGLYEHNLYPLRYNKAVSDITRTTNNENIIWARSAWAGSQRYPLHWGGDAANTNVAMATTLRGGLSFGISGFPFWSHDIGGFVVAAPEDLYRRWLPFGFLTSHTRIHGAPPTEPWLYNKAMVDAFRASAEMKYKLMPYVYAQAKNCTETGLPMVRALFIEFPEDPGAWKVEDEYMFGNDILVAPFFENTEYREVYLPGKEKWIDYQTGKIYAAGWNKIPVTAIPAIILVREGAAIPHVKVAQSTDKIDWSNIILNVYATKDEIAKGLLYLPNEEKTTTLEVTVKKGSKKLTTQVEKCNITVK